MVTSVPSHWAGPAPAALPSFPTLSLSPSLPPPCVWHLPTQCLGRGGGAQRSSRTTEGVQQPQESRHLHCSGGWTQLAQLVLPHLSPSEWSSTPALGTTGLYLSWGSRSVAELEREPEPEWLSWHLLAYGSTQGTLYHSAHGQATLVPDQHHGQVFQILHPLHPLPALVDVLP